MLFREGNGLHPKTKPISGVWMNVIAEGKADFVQKQTPISGVWTNVGAEGYVHKYIPIYEVGMNVIAVGKANFVKK